MEGERPRSDTVTTTVSSHMETISLGGSIAYDRSFLRSPTGVLLLMEIMFGLLVWALIAGSEYFLVSAFGWVMFVAVFYWVLSVFFFLLHLTRANTRITKVPWSLVGLCFNGSAFVLYLIAAVVEASSVNKDVHQHHNYNSWTASSYFILRFPGDRVKTTSMEYDGVKMVLMPGEHKIHGLPKGRKD
ncbi:MARVEL domain-containing protein 1 isoform X1 [Xenopus laevis]|uniref:MARVEL domain-containing protein 1 isoform X1 n=1 Tax=Xenopus laevis TaxID=8355 RepID=A0A8J1KXC2_XENLA|nr:MARVEL domain-containing protein 1 isoform X1 [Xenopus laevis]